MNSNCHSEYIELKSICFKIPYKNTQFNDKNNC